MHQINYIKETIAYLKFWLGIMVVSEISLLGWLLANVGAASNLKSYSAILLVVVTTIPVYYVHRRIENLILRLEGV